MEYEEPLYGTNYGSIPFTPDERAFNDLQHVVAKSRLASKKYEQVISKQPVTRRRSLKPAILKAKSKYILYLRELLTKAQKLHDEAIAAENNIYKNHAAKNMKTASQQIHDLQYGGSRRRRIKSAHKKSKRHKKTHRRKH
jgi:hypothetical protein